MPFLTKVEFETYIGPTLAAQLVETAAAFETAEQAAAQKVIRITGVNEPVSAAEAPVWAKAPVAFLVMHALSGQMQWSQDRRQWAREMRDDALNDLREQAALIEESPDDPTSGAVGAVDGVVSF